MRGFICRTIEGIFERKKVPMKRLTLVLVLAFAFLPAVALAQKVSESEQNPKTTQAYTMLIQHKVKVQAKLESLLNEYGSDWPPSKELQFELDTIKSEMKKMAEVEEAKVIKLTSGFGSLVLRRIALATEVHTLLEENSSEWPPFKQKLRELELLDQDIQRLLR
jgi:hypothetical protein